MAKLPNKIMIKTVLRQQVLSYTSYSSSIYLSKVEESCPQTSSRNTLKQRSHGIASPNAKCEHLPTFFFYKTTFSCKVRRTFLTSKSILPLFLFHLGPSSLVISLHYSHSLGFTICLLCQTSSSPHLLSTAHTTLSFAKADCIFTGEKRDVYTKRCFHKAVGSWRQKRTYNNHTTDDQNNKEVTAEILGFF